MLLLACVLLCNLQFDRLVGVTQPGKEWRHGLAYLEVDGTVLDLHNGVLFELAIERMKVVVSGFRAIILEVVPVEMVVVDERAIEHDAAMK